jgi:hypothetical protein
MNTTPALKLDSDGANDDGSFQHTSSMDGTIEDAFICGRFVVIACVSHVWVRARQVGVVGYVAFRDMVMDMSVSGRQRTKLMVVLHIWSGIRAEGTGEATAIVL